MSQSILPIVQSPFERVVSGVFAAGIAGGTVMVAAFDPDRSSFFPFCPLLKLTGIACPGCGLTRGFHSLFHLDLIGALDFNALIPFYAVGLVMLFVSLLLSAVRGRGLNYDRFPGWAFYAFLVIAAGFTVVRNLPFEPFSVLYP
jgi:hypothetical protein